MKKSNVAVNRENKTLAVSKSFYKKASVFGSLECAELAEAEKMFPDYSVVIAISTKKAYHGLSFERMVDYIITQPDSVQRLNEMERVMEIAKSKGALYPLTKKWFLHTYPEYKDNSVSDGELSELLDTLESEDDNSLPKAANM